MESHKKFRISGSVEYHEFRKAMATLYKAKRNGVCQARPTWAVTQLVMVAAIVAGGLLTFDYFGVKIGAPQFTGCTVIWICIGTLVSRFENNFVYKILFEHRHRYFEPLELTVDAQGLRVAKPNLDERIGWPLILDLQENDGILLVFNGPVSAYIILKRWFPDEATWAACLAFSRQQLAASREGAAAA